MSKASYGVRNLLRGFAVQLEQLEVAREPARGVSADRCHERVQLPGSHKSATRLRAHLKSGLKPFVVTRRAHENANLFNQYLEG